MQMGDGTEYKTHKVYGCICTAELTKISPSGKWIATTYRTEEPNEGGMSFSITQRPHSTTRKPKRPSSWTNTATPPACT